jgi:xanthine/uracil/vitamin C permease (AzgA family)
VLGVIFVKILHHILHLGHMILYGGRLFVLADGLLVVIIVIEEHREYVFHSFTLRVTHGVSGGVGALGYELMFQAVALAVASDDAAHLPETDVIQKLTAGDSYFAHEQLIDVVGVS